MKKIFGFLISLQIAFGSAGAAAAASAGDGASAGIQASEDRLAQVLRTKFDLTVKEQGDSLKFEGPEDKIRAFLEAFSDFDKLRRHFLTPMRQTTKCASTVINSWGTCFQALGIDPVDVELVNISKATDEDECLKFLNSAGCNQRVAQLYIDTLKEKSAFFNWAAKEIKELVTVGDNGITLNYGLLKAFLCPPTHHEPGLTEVTLTREWLLKHIIASSSGSITLEPVSGRSGEYHLNIASLGQTAPTESEIVIMIDVSSSMAGAGIAAINAHMPNLLRNLLEACNQRLPRGSVVELFIIPFNHKLGKTTIYKHTVGQAPNPIQWTTLEASGATDLTLIGNELEPSEGSLASLIAFTDGKHEANVSIPEHMENMRALHATGEFAFPFLCPVGDATDSYFKEMNKIFGGCYTENQTVQEFCESVSRRAVEIVEPKDAFILTLLRGQTVTFWKKRVTGLVQAPHTLKVGESVRHEGQTYTISNLFAAPAAHYRDPAAVNDTGSDNDSSAGNSQTSLAEGLSNASLIATKDAQRAEAEQRARDAEERYNALAIQMAQMEAMIQQLRAQQAMGKAAATRAEDID